MTEALEGHRLLVAVRDGHAFDPAIANAGLLRDLHVPFDGLVGGSGVEGRFAAAVRAGERVALVGGSGVGKSSVMAHVLAGWEDDLAPIRVPVDVESGETIREPGALVRHVLQTVARQAAAAGEFSRAERQAYVAEASRRLSVGREHGRDSQLELTLPWLVRGTVAQEVVLTLGGEVDRSAGESLAALDRLMALLRAHGLEPVLVIDDSDRWLRVPGVADTSDNVAAFFGRPLRMLAERGVALVVAVHDHYLEMDGYRQQVPGFLDTTVRVPALPDRTALAAILGRRVEREVPGAGWADAMDDDALRGLWLHYLHGARRSLRRTLQVMHIALATSVEQGAERVRRRAVDAAVAESL